MLHLNTQSRVDVRFSSATREVRLLDGEALFTVAHDSTRPLRVHAKDVVV